MAPSLAVWLGSYDLEFRAAVRRAADDGFDACAASALEGVLQPRELSQTGRRQLRRFVEEVGLPIAALALEFPGAGLADPHHAAERLARTRETLSLARDLGAGRVVVRSAGFEPPAPTPLALELLHELADLSDRSGIVVALLAADGRAAQAAPHVRTLACPTLGLALDCLDVPDVASLREFAAGIAGIVIARDVRRRGAGIEAVAYGEGDVDFAELLAFLDESGYRGPIILRCETRRDAPAVLAAGRRHLASLAGAGGHGPASPTAAGERGGRIWLPR